MKEGDSMKTIRFALVVLLAAFVFASSGCLPRWSVDHVQYGLSKRLYQEGDVGGTPVMEAADGYTYLIVKVNLNYNGLAPANIRDELRFVIFDPVPPVVNIENFYEDSPYTLYDALQEQFPGKGGDTGSVFFLIPDTLDLNRYTFKVTDKAFNLINQASIAYIPQRTYPGQF